MTCYPQIRRFAAAVAFAGLGCAMQQVLAAPIVIPTAPLYVGASVQPLVMLDITKDQNLYKKAYDDYSDLDGDGWAETTYDHTIDYYGYFDSYKCYSYSTANGYFSPVAAPSVDANDKFIKPATCSGNWHGNFLNWVAMSRMDTVRKLLYGGYRSTDTGDSDCTRARLHSDGCACLGQILQPRYRQGSRCLARTSGYSGCPLPDNRQAHALQSADDPRGDIEFQRGFLGRNARY